MPVKIFRKVICDADNDSEVILSDGDDGQLLFDVKDGGDNAFLYMNRETWEEFKALGDAVFAEMEAQKKP